MSGDEEVQELRRRARAGDRDANRALLERTVRDHGLSHYVIDHVATLLGQQAYVSAEPLRDECGAVAYFVGDRDVRGCWRCPVCGAGRPYTFWKIRSRGTAATPADKETIVVALAEGACAFCGEVGECRCVRAKKILGDEVLGLEGKVAMWRRDRTRFARGVDDPATPVDERAKLEGLVAKVDRELAEFEASLDKARALHAEYADVVPVPAADKEQDTPVIPGPRLREWLQASRLPTTPDAEHEVRPLGPPDLRLGPDAPDWDPLA